MEAQLLHQALQGLPHAGHSASKEQVQRFGELVDSELPLQSFLEQLLPELVHMFDGIAAVAWLKAQGAPGALFGVRYKMDRVLSSITEQKKHERLVQVAWQNQKAMFAEAAHPLKDPSSSDEQPDVSRPALLFGPVLHGGESIALLEIVLHQSEDAISDKEKQVYLRSIQLVAHRVYGGLRQRMTMPTPTLQQAVSQLGQLTDEIQSIHQQIVRSIESRLQQFRGWSFPTLADNQSLAKMIHQLLDSHGLRVECPECGNPAILRCLRAGNAKNGAFVFDHYLSSGRTFHGGPTTLPLLKVVKKPARRLANSSN